jgi:hypothetical protein
MQDASVSSKIRITLGVALRLHGEAQKLSCSVRWLGANLRSLDRIVVSGVRNNMKDIRLHFGQWDVVTIGKICYRSLYSSLLYSVKL